MKVIWRDLRAMTWGNRALFALGTVILICSAPPPGWVIGTLMSFAALLSVPAPKRRDDREYVMRDGRLVPLDEVADGP